MDIMLFVIEQGLVWGLVVLGIYLSFRVVNVPDLSADGTLTLGAAVAARLIIDGFPPILATVAGLVAGGLGGMITGILHTRLKIQPLLASIITMTGLYSINLRVMGRANIALMRVETLIPKAGRYDTVLFFAAVMAAVIIALILFLKTDLGLALRATGDNDQMVRSVAVSSDRMKVLGLTIGNALVGLGGALIAQYTGFADAQMGIGTVVVGLAALILGEMVFGSRTVAQATVAVVMGSILYRLIVTGALRAGFNASDLKLVTAILVILALSIPKAKRLIRA